MQCYACGSYDLYQYQHDVCCRNCCTMQDYPDLVANEFDFHYAPIVPVQDNIKTIMAYLSCYDEIETLHLFPQNAIEYSKGMVACYTERHTFQMSEDAKRAFVYASLYYSLKNYKLTAFDKTYFTKGLVDATDFSKACKLLKDKKLPEYNHLFIEVSTKKTIVDSCLKVLRMCKHSTATEAQVRANIYKIHDIIRDARELSTSQPSTLAATVVYMAHLFSHVKITMSRISEMSGVTVATIIKLENIIKNVIIKAKTTST